ncbi:hypothetical protein GCM10011504_42570 [Siccirubricoccus deserti]|nr:hypothetical protein [Siccirubricoccus deserti]GGC59859.1 hypothetical protein GCM10011504_42570 [Siccirubricoccus deserti]
MKAFLIGTIVAVALATAAALVLDNEVQRTAEQHYQTGAVRL